MKPKVKFEKVSKKYSLYQKKSDKLFDIFLNNKKNESFFALKDISFEVNAGETIGIVGINGSGKSTLSNLLAQIIPPTSGDVEINGEPSLIAISAGLNNHLTGMENINLKCLMLGLKENEIRRITNEIVEFADIGKFINQPVKNYSSGMKARLGFAISVHTNPDILVVDEALSVGDQTFYNNCISKINEFKASGKTIFFISHSISQIQSISDKVLWLHFGTVKEYGDADTVLKHYNEFIKWFNNLSKNEKKEYRTNQLEEQLEKLRYFKYKTGKKKKKVWYNYTSIFLQLMTLLFCVTLAGILLFKENPSNLISNFLERFNTETEIAENIEVPLTASESDIEGNSLEEIGKEALVINRKVDVFFEEDLNYKMDELDFATLIYVEKGSNNSLKVLYKDNTTGYVNSKGIKFYEKKARTDVISLDYFLPLFPTSFAESYEYYAAFLGSDYEEIKTLFSDAIEKNDNKGRNLLDYKFGSLTYGFNQNNIANTMIIENINDEVLLEEVLHHADISSIDGKLYYYELKNYNLTLDLDNNLIEIHSLNEPAQ